MQSSILVSVEGIRVDSAQGVKITIPIDMEVDSNDIFTFKTRQSMDSELVAYQKPNDEDISSLGDSLKDSTKRESLLEDIAQFIDWYMDAGSMPYEYMVDTLVSCVDGGIRKYSYGIGFYDYYKMFPYQITIECNVEGNKRNSVVRECSFYGCLVD